MQVQMMVGAVKDVKEAAFFLKKEKPYWWDLKGQALSLKKEADDLVETIRVQGAAWVKTTVKGIKDDIGVYTEGGVSTVSVKARLSVCDPA